MTTPRGIKLSRSRTKTIHAQLRERLLADFDRYNDGDRLPTEMEFAEQFKISRLTVHKVVNELQRDGYVVRHVGKGTFVRHGDRPVYTEDFRAANGTVVIAYPEWFSYDIWVKVKRARQIAMRDGVGLVEYRITRETVYRSLRDMCKKTRDCRGVIIIPPGGPFPKDAVDQFEEFGIPVVLLNPNARPSRNARNVYVVHQDYERIGYIDVSTLCDRGHRRMAYVASQPWDDSYRIQLQGMKKALADRGLTQSALWWPRQHARPWEHAGDVAYTIVRTLLTDLKPTAMIFDAVPDAIGGLRAGWELLGAEAAKLCIVINSPWFDLERFFWPPPILVSCDMGRVMEEAMTIISGTSPNSVRRILVGDPILREFTAAPV